MTNVVVSVLLVAIVAAAVFYIVRAKKRGQKCIGCSSCDCGKCCGNTRRIEF